MHAASVICAYHPGELTGLSCGVCATPLCVDCAQHTQVGTRCAACLSGRVGPSQEAAAGAPTWGWAAATVIFGALTATALIISMLGLAVVVHAAARRGVRVGRLVAAAGGYVLFLCVATWIVQRALPDGQPAAQALDNLHLPLAAGLLVVAGSVAVAAALAQPAWSCAQELARRGARTLAGLLLGCSALAVLVSGYLAATLLAFSV